jgi:hypothetical protein
MVEIFFAIITRQAIRRGSFTSVKDLGSSSTGPWETAASSPHTPS